MAVLAPALATLRTQINDMWPNRSKASDGWIGDAAHAARVSDHNPDSRGIVHALDITVQGIDKAAVISAAQADPRTKYIISDRRIWQPSTGWQPYTGSNPHTQHVHISCTTAGEHLTAPWALPTLAGENIQQANPTPSPAQTPANAGNTAKTANTMQAKLGAKMPTLDLNKTATGLPVKRLQALLTANGHPPTGGIDGSGGSHTKAALISFQKAKNLLPDAICGPATWNTLLGVA